MQLYSSIYYLYSVAIDSGSGIAIFRKVLRHGDELTVLYYKLTTNIKIQSIELQLKYKFTNLFISLTTSVF